MLKNKWMETNELMLCAYHESGRVVFAYLAGYHCTNITLSNSYWGNGASTINGAGDNPLIKRVLQQDVPDNPTDKQLVYNIAAKLTVIFCAGTCARLLLEKNGQITNDTELEFPGQDSKYIDQLQQYMKKCNSTHPDNYLSGIVSGLFTQLQKPENWKAVKYLADKATADYDAPLNRYTIEDTLMASGFKIKRVAVSSGFNVGVTEAPDKPETEKPTEKNKQNNDTDLLDESPLDIVLKNYLKIIRSDWGNEEVGKSLQHIKEIFKKYSTR